jgi:hypothetical protein
MVQKIQGLGRNDVIALIPEFSAPFSHTTVTHNIITVYTTQSTINLGCALSFCSQLVGAAMIVSMFQQ